MHWRNNFLWVLTCHNLFKWLRILGSFSVLQDCLHQRTHFTPYWLLPLLPVHWWFLAPCQPLTLQSDHALPEETWNCLVRVSSVMIVSLIIYRCVRKRKALSYFWMLFFPFSQSGVKKKKNFTNTWAPLRHSLDKNKERGEGKLMDLGNTNCLESDYSQLGWMVQLW